MKRKVLFIVNPIAGRSSKEPVVELVEKLLDKNKVDYEIRNTEYAGHASVLAKEAAGTGYDIVVAVGGDGTINEVARQLVGNNTALGIIPLGSGNGLARHLGCPLRISEAIRVINNGVVSVIDVGVAGDRYFFSTAGIGFDAHVTHHYAKGKQRGFWGYFSVIMKEFFHYQAHTYFLTLDDQQPVQIEAFLIACANSSQYGYDFFIAPQADIRDGYLHVCVIKKFPKWILPWLVLLILLKKHHWSTYIAIEKAINIRLEGSSIPCMNIDGECVPAQPYLKIGIKPLTLKVLTPSGNE